MRQAKVRKFLSCFLVITFVLSFSISAFAGYSFEYDGSTINQSYSGTNYVYVDGYNMDDGWFMNNMINRYSGTTYIDGDEAYSDGFDIGSTYSGTLHVTASDENAAYDYAITELQGPTINANTTVTVQDTQSNDTLNAGVRMIDPTFNSGVSINSPVTNITLGSSSLMNDLLDLLYAIYFTCCVNYSFADSTGHTTYVSDTNPWTGNSVSIRLLYFDNSSLTYNPGTGFTRTNLVGLGTLAGMINFRINNILSFLSAISSYLFNNTTFRVYDLQISGETYSITSSASTTSFFRMIDNRLNVIIGLLSYFTSKFYEWYYPLDSTTPFYWRYYNTDTELQESIGLAGLMYNISWYLGQMYALTGGSEAIENFQDQVESVTDTLESAEEQEQAIISSISSGINSFNPQLSDIQTFRALSWVSNYLQQIFLALGTYGTVILVGLILAVCMQFIGYFRYK